MKIVKVDWIDAQVQDVGCLKINEAKGFEIIPASVVGFVVEETKDKIILSHEKWEDDMGVKYIHIIPKRSILKITELREVGK